MTATTASALSRGAGLSFRVEFEDGGAVGEDGRQALAEFVVQFTRQAATLFFLHADQLLRKLAVLRHARLQPVHHAVKGCCDACKLGKIERRHARGEVAVLDLVQRAQDLVHRGECAPDQPVDENVGDDEDHPGKAHESGRIGPDFADLE